MSSSSKYDSAGSSARVKQIVASAPDPIRATSDLTDPDQFQEDFRASRVIDSTWPHQDITVRHSERRPGPSAFVNYRQKQDDSMASRVRS